MFVSSTEIQNNFGKYLKLCKFDNVIITKNGKKRAVMLHYPRNSEGFEAGEPVQHYGTSPPKRPKNYVTYKDFQELVKNTDVRYELIDGVTYQMASPGFSHQRILGLLNDAFREFFKNHDLCDAFVAPLDIELIRESTKLKREVDEDDINIVQPDIMVLCDYQKDISDEDKYKGTPSLVVEILSPSTSSHDRIRKLSLYLECGVGEYWIVDPKGNKIMVYAFEDCELANDGTFLPGMRAESFVFPGLGVDIDSIYEAR